MRSLAKTLAVAVAAAAALLNCRQFEVVSVQSGGWPVRTSEINIGFFESSGSASRSSNRNNLYESLSFSLRENGFRARDAQDVFALLAGNELPSTRLLTEPEILRLGGLLPGRIFLQGRFEEVLTQTLVEDRIQLQVNVNVYSLETGKRLAEIRVYGKDLEGVAGQETLQVSRLVAKRLKEIAPLSAARADGPGGSASRGTASGVSHGSGAFDHAAEIEEEERIHQEMRRRYAADFQIEKSLLSGAPHSVREGVLSDTPACFERAAANEPARLSESSRHGRVPSHLHAVTRGSVFRLDYYSIRNGYAGDRSDA